MLTQSESGATPSPSPQRTEVLQKTLQNLRRAYTNARKHRAILSFLLVAFLLLPIPHVVPQMHEVAKAVIIELSVALIIAAAIALTIEKYTLEQIESEFNTHLRDGQQTIERIHTELTTHVSNEQHSIEDIQRSLDNYLATLKERCSGHMSLLTDKVCEHFIASAYGNKLPAQLVPILKKTLFEQSVVRRDLSITAFLYDLSKANAAVLGQQLGVTRLEEDMQQARKDELPFLNDIIVFTECITYNAINITHSSVEHKIGVRVNRMCGGRYKHFAGILNVVADNKPLIDHPIFETHEDEGPKDPTAVAFHKSVKIAPGQALPVQLELYSVRLNEGNDAWWFVNPTEGVVFRLVDLSWNTRFSIRLKAPHLREDEDYIKTKEKATQVAMFQTKQLLLPYQGLEFKWTNIGG